MRVKGARWLGAFMLLASSDASADSSGSALDGAEGGSSVSCASVNGGALRRAQKLPERGRGYVVPKPWQTRGRQYGTDELIQLIEEAAAYVDTLFPGGTLGVADMSSRRGGPIGLHRSHQNGRDADLIFYALDENSNPFPPDEHMAFYDSHGQSLLAKAPRRTRKIKRRFFDLNRNWTLVHSMLTSDLAKVTHIFVSPQVKNWLIRYAKSRREPKRVIKAAHRVLRPDALKNLHNDHFHVRIACSKEDVALGTCGKKLSRAKLSLDSICPRDRETTAALSR